MKGQRVAHITQVARFQNALKIRRFIYPNFFLFGRCLVELIVLPRSIVSFVKSAFLSLEFSLKWAVSNDRCSVLILKFRQKFKFAFHENLTLLINRDNKIFQLPGRKILDFGVDLTVLTASKANTKIFTKKKSKM